MKETRITLAFFMTTLALSLFTYKSNAQFGGIPGTGNAGLETTNPPNQVVSIGDIPINGAAGLNLVRAKLHVNSFFMTASSATNPVSAGDVFRTTGSNAVENNWRLFTGAANPGIENFSLFVPANSNNVFLQTTQPNSDMVFNTGGANERMRITATGSITINSLCSTTQSLVTADKNGTLTTTTAETLISHSQTILELQQKITGLETIVNQLTAQNFKTEGN